MNKEILEWAQLCASGSCEDCRACILPLKHTSCVEVFAKAILDHHEKYRWHDLVKNPDDLPEDDSKDYFVKEVWADGDAIYTTARRHYIVFHGLPTDAYNFAVVAWREIDEFESEDSDG